MTRTEQTICLIAGSICMFIAFMGAAMAQNAGAVGTGTGVGQSQSNANQMLVLEAARATDELKTVPDAIAPALYHTGDCLEGWSAAASILGGGISGGGATEDTKCTYRTNGHWFRYQGLELMRVAIELRKHGLPLEDVNVLLTEGRKRMTTGEYIMCNDPETAAAMKDANVYCPQHDREEDENVATVSYSTQNAFPGDTN